MALSRGVASFAKRISVLALVIDLFPTKIQTASGSRLILPLHYETRRSFSTEKERDRGRKFRARVAKKKKRRKGSVGCCKNRSLADQLEINRGLFVLVHHPPTFEMADLYASDGSCLFSFSFFSFLHPLRPPLFCLYINCCRGRDIRLEKNKSRGGTKFVGGKFLNLQHKRVLNTWVDRISNNV